MQKLKPTLPPEWTGWPAPPADLRLLPGQVQVWSAPIPADFEPALVKHWLSPAELARAGCFRFDRERETFIFARASLRQLLGSYLELAPERVELSVSPTGKPALARPRLGAEICFNVSHAGGRVLLALALECAVGVDLEPVRPLPDLEELAERFFTPREAASLLALPPAARPERFFRYWTRKEAWLKASGVGLAQPLHTVDVTDLPPGSGAETVKWFDLTPAPQFVAALVVTVPGLTPSCFTFEGFAG